jgi:hypothetical protein
MGSRPCEVTRCDGTERPGVAIGRVAWSPPCVVATVVAKILASSPTNHICYGCGRTLLFQIVQELHAYSKPHSFNLWLRTDDVLPGGLGLELAERVCRANTDREQKHPSRR